MTTSFRLALAFVLGAMISSVALAQSPAPAWGTTSLSSVVVSAMDMVTDQAAVGYGTNPLNGHRYLTNAGLFYGSVHVPQGARIVQMELEACDTLSGGSVDANLYRANEAGRTSIGFVTTGIAAADGCSRWSVDLATPETVHNDAYRYYVEAGNAPSDDTETIGAVRVYYQLQVSNAPVAATFNDVSIDNPFFQFIEALAASGITAGCGGGKFCPNSPVTRGQMAVFLAKALGLNWPVQTTTN